MYTDYDVIIIGSGCAGLTAGLYTGRAGFDTLIIERETMGGELMNRQLIENYPGFAAGVQGPDLGSAMLKQTAGFGAEIEAGEVIEIADKAGFKVVTTDSDSYTCKGVVIAAGSFPRKLGVSGEAELSDRGVFYCATCDGPQLAGKSTIVAGAGDSGITEALYLEKLGCKVTVVEALPEPKASKVLLDRALENPHIEIICGAKIVNINGDDWVASVEIVNVETNAKECLEAQGVLVRIGMIPNTEFVSGLLTLSDGGQIEVDECMQTNIAGIFAAGDVRQHSPMQFATAVGDGVTAAMSLGHYLTSIGNN